MFVSHGSRDKWIAKQICRCISDVGGRFFVDAYDLKTGDVIEDRSWEELSRCNELVALFTPHSNRRSWVWMEIGAARAAKLRVAVVLHGLTVDDLEREHGGGGLYRSLARDLNDVDLYFEELRARCDHEH